MKRTFLTTLFFVAVFFEQAMAQGDSVRVSLYYGKQDSSSFLLLNNSQTKIYHQFENNFVIKIASKDSNLVELYFLTSKFMFRIYEFNKMFRESKANIKIKSIKMFLRRRREIEYLISVGTLGVSVNTICFSNKTPEYLEVKKNLSTK